LEEPCRGSSMFQQNSVID